MRNFSRSEDTRRKAITALYSNIGAEIPRHLLPDMRDNSWRRYEVEKELIPPCSSQEYERKIVNFTPTDLERRGAAFLERKDADA